MTVAFESGNHFANSAGAWEQTPQPISNALVSVATAKALAILSFESITYLEEPLLFRPRSYEFFEDFQQFWTNVLIYRETFEMNRFRNKSYKEIADQMNVSPKTVAWRMSKVLAELRKSLRDFL